MKKINFAKQKNIFSKKSTSKSLFSFDLKKITLCFATAAVSVFTLSFSSCSLFTSFKDTKITDYLNQQSTEIKIVDAEFSNSFPLDKDKVISIPSDSDYTIKYLIQNPDGLKIDSTVTNNSDESVSSLLVPYTYEITEDNNYVNVTLTKEMLKLMEKGGDISPVVLIAAESYGYDIDPYTYAFRANSPPPVVEGACLMIDTSYAREQTSSAAASKGRYVLCLNLPEEVFDSNGIHNDLNKIYITGINAAYTKGVPLDIDTENKTWNTNALPSSYSTGLVKNSYNGTAAVTFSPKKYPVYILTSTYSSKSDTQEYTITLEDTKGLKSTVNLNTQSCQLKPVTANVEEGKTYQLLDSAKYYTAILKAPTSCVGVAVPTSIEDVDVYYRLYIMENKKYTLLSQGNVTDSYSSNLTEGYYKIEAYAHKEGYVDSELSTWSFIVGNIDDVSISIETTWDVSFEMTLTPLILSQYKISTNHTLTLSISAKDKNGTALTDEEFAALGITDVSLKLYDRDTQYIPATESDNDYALDVPLYIQADTYTVSASLIYKETIYTGNFSISVVE